MAISKKAVNLGMIMKTFRLELSFGKLEWIFKAISTPHWKMQITNMWPFVYFVLYIV